MSSSDPAAVPSPMPHSPAALAPKDRVITIDILRGIALFGVLMVNLVTMFRVSLFELFAPSHASTKTQLDRFFDAFVTYALDMKAWSLFSLLFGVGLAIQFDRLAAHDRPTYWLRRRLFVLLGFGLCHLLFIWNGDILTEYALAGLLVLPLMRQDKGTLVFYALVTLGFFVAMPVLYSPVYWPNPRAASAALVTANQVYAHGDFLQTRQLNLSELRLITPLLWWGFPRTIGLVLLGAWIWKADILRRLRALRFNLLVFGVLAVAMGVVVTFAGSKSLLSEYPKLQDALSRLGPPVQALGYAALIAIAVDQLYLGRLLRAFAPLGRMAFSNYILQSIIFGWIFFGYGLGQFGRLGTSQAFLLGVAVYIAQMIGSALWLHRFQFGPLEWLWRSLMYGQKQPMRK
jgi:uncharacterized protein